MSKRISRRDFLKLAGAAAAGGAVLTGCGPASRYVIREPYIEMPEYNFNGQSTYYATTCRECPAGCGLVVRTYQGRAIKVEGNQRHPVNLGKTCARGQATLHGLYNPDRVTAPVKQGRAGALSNERITWEQAIQVVADALANTPPSAMAFLLGLAPDHLFDLVGDLTKALGAPAPLRFGALALFEARSTLTRAAAELFGRPALPFFDLANAGLIFSFGANFLETWLSPVAYTRGFSRMRKQQVRGHWVQFEARMSQTAAKADEWIPLRPGSEGLVAAAMGKLAAEAKGQAAPGAFAAVDVAAAVEASGVPEETLRRLAGLFAAAERPLVIPGSAALGQANGLGNAKAVLALNVLAGNVGQPGGVFLSPLPPLAEKTHALASLQEMAEFIEKMKAGAIQVLFVHGVNPLFELPKSFGFEQALQKVPLVISFATFPDETALQADYIFPDHHGLESWGYQRIATGSTRSALSGAQPVVSPYYDTRATADVLLAACAAVGGKLAAALPFADEVAFIQDKLLPLVEVKEANFNAPEINTFSAYFQQFGGWWAQADGLISPTAPVLGKALNLEAPQYQGEGEFVLLPFVSPVLGEAGANKPWLQEVPDPTTTVMWNTWVEIHPKVAHELGLENDDVVMIVSEAGAVEASVYLYPAIRPDTIAIPFGQGHSAYGRYAAGRGVNPLDLVAPVFNLSGDLAFAGMKVRLEKTGKKRELARLESKIGVYGEGFEEH